MALPFLPRARRAAVARQWDTVKPVSRVEWFTERYTRHDRSVLFVFRGVVALLPVVLSRLGVSLAVVAGGVVVGVYVTETLARKRESLLQARWVKDARRYHKEQERRAVEVDPSA